MVAHKISLFKSSRTTFSYIHNIAKSIYMMSYNKLKIDSQLSWIGHLTASEGEHMILELLRMSNHPFDAITPRSTSTQSLSSQQYR